MYWIFIAVRNAFLEIWTYKSRSLLTVFSISLGICSLVGMVALTNGIEKGMKETMIAMGGADKVLTREQQVPPDQEHLADQAPGRTIADVIALQYNATLLRLISPELAIQGAVVSKGERSARPSECVGVWPAVLEMNLHKIAYGRFFTDIDDEKAHAVCVIGTGIRDALFGSPTETGKEIIPIGELIYINGQPFTIVGMFEEYMSEQQRRVRGKPSTTVSLQQGPERRRGYGPPGGWAFWMKNNTVYIPLKTAWLRFRAVTARNEIPDPRLTDIDLKVKDFDRISDALQQTRNIMFFTHRGIEDFAFETQEARINEINFQVRNIRITGGIIALISLIVGGVGIMNIMLASINERIREIGISKAIGATNLILFFQILLESLIIALMGGIVGILCSFGFVDILRGVSPTGNEPEIGQAALIVAVVFSGAVGIIAGVYPAVRGATLSPIEALRYE